jgi:hypothetical protein
MKQILIATAIALASFSCSASSDKAEEPKTREVCYDKDGRPAEKGTKGAVCKKIRVHKMYDGVKIPPAKK